MKPIMNTRNRFDGYFETEEKSYKCVYISQPENVHRAS